MATGVRICSGVTPSASVELNMLITFGSFIGIVVGSTPVKSCSIRIIVGSSWPRMSSLSRFASKAW